MTFFLSYQWYTESLIRTIQGLNCWWKTLWCHIRCFMGYQKRCSDINKKLISKLFWKSRDNFFNIINPSLIQNSTSSVASCPSLRQHLASLASCPFSSTSSLGCYDDFGCLCKGIFCNSPAHKKVGWAKSSLCACV